MAEGDVPNGGGAGRGWFITLEGGEGAGKTTQLCSLADALRETGREVVTTREPGGSPGAERVRSVLIDPEAELTPLCEAMLHAGARHDHLANTIRPALARGACVLCDRFADSTRAYQGFGLGLPESTVDTLEDLAVGETTPDLTLILDVPVDVGLERARGRGVHDRYEAMAVAFHERLRAGYRAIAERAPARCAVVDANRPAEAVQAEVRRIVRERLGFAL
jgi:dTMP kinase